MGNALLAIGLWMLFCLWVYRDCRRHARRMERIYREHFPDA